LKLGERWLRMRMVLTKRGVEVEKLRTTRRE
jgi:hypothetical protein